MKEVIFNRKLLPLSLASLTSKIGDFAHEVVFALITIELLSGDIFYIGLVYFLKFIPYLFSGPVGGWIADVFPFKRNMLLSDTLRLSVTFVMFITYYLGILNIAGLVVCAMLMTIGRSLFQPSFRSYLPFVLNKEELPAGNSLFQIIEDVASIIGPLLCALIISVADKSFVLLADAITYALSLIFLLLLKKNQTHREEKLSFTALFTDTKESISNLRNHQTDLFMVIIGTTACVLFTAALLKYVLPAIIVEHYLREELVGYVFSVMATGTVMGGILYPRIVKDTTPELVMKSWMLYGVLFVLVAIAININQPALFTSVFILGFVGAIVDISIITNIQTLSRQGELGKNYGLYSTVANTGESLSGIVAGALTIVAGGFSFICMATSIVISAKWALVKLRKEEKAHERTV
ncbi:MFS transporter [Photobacterium sp. CAU 1568]|uniref:MFS transporter n=1 Tax=Photobacterium arenosum TaxID=2774143 RepID=A0ABR9BPZ7_9GAMM|nr:MFS transporter [Photobacterium arenosum]MBD8514648.1 MFS transporter [Photobacterium arenosum]